jgi:hypothetical protein
MGQEIVYCFKCQKRILGAEFAKGQAYQVGLHVSCSGCATELLLELGPREREQLLAKMFKATQERQSASGAALPALTSSSTRVKAAKSSDRRRTTAHIPIVRPPRTVPETSSSPLVLAGAAAGVAVVLAVVFFAASRSSAPDSDAASAPKLEPTSSKSLSKEPSESPEVTRRRAAARGAVQQARDFTRTTPQDLQGQIRLWEQAQAASESTPYSAEVRRELTRLVSQRKETVAKELSDLEAQTAPRLKAEEFKAAIDIFKSARARYDAPDWTEPIDRRTREIYETAARLLPTLKDNAAHSLQRQATSEVQPVRERVVRWGFPEFATDFESSLTAVVPAAGATRPDADASIVGSWPLDEGKGTTAADVSGRAGKATLKGATWTAGRAGSAVHLDGTGTYLELSNSPALDKLQEDSYTLSAWFRPEGLPSNSKDDFGGVYAILMKGSWREGLMYTHGGNFMMVHWLAGPKWTSVGSWTESFAPEVWYHVTGVVDRSAGKEFIYVNGQVKGTENIPKGATAVAFGEEKWWVGKTKNGEAPVYFARASVSDVRLFSRALDAAEVAALFESKAGR